MTTYKELFGKAVRFLDTDPTNDAEGQVWYNTTSGTFKSQVLLAAAWASGGNLGTGRYALASATNGSQTAALGSFGNTGPVSASVASESYNGSTWTATPNGNVAREALAGAGTQTAAVSFGGFYYPEYAPGGPGNKNNTEKFDGSSWTNSGVMNTGRRYLGGCGTQTAALAFGGNELRATPDTIGSTEEFNGSTWTNNPTGLNTARSNFSGAGTQTAALAFGGTPGTANESYNGSTWTTVNPLNTGRFGLAGAGSQTAAIAMGGGPASASTETWNGTSWSASTNMTTGRYGLGGAGTQASALVFGGSSPTKTATEEFTNATLTVKTITTS